MKISAREKTILAVAALFLAFLAGWLCRGRMGRAITVESQRVLAGGTEAAEFSAPPATERVDVNRATAEELTHLPGIGESLAQAIVDERERGGPYLYPEDLIRVKGIGAESVQKLLDYITAGE